MHASQNDYQVPGGRAGDTVCDGVTASIADPPLPHLGWQAQGSGPHGHDPMAMTLGKVCTSMCSFPHPSFINASLCLVPCQVWAVPGQSKGTVCLEEESGKRFLEAVPPSALLSGFQGGRGTSGQCDCFHGEGKPCQGYPPLLLVSILVKTHLGPAPSKSQGNHLTCEG